MNYLRPAALTLTLSLAAAMALPAERGQAKATLAGKAVSIEYGRPTLQGRDMLGRAEVGSPWRMGADAPTRLKTAATLVFAPGIVVAPGEYVLTATKTGADEWQLNIKKTDAAGDSAVIEVPLVSKVLPESVETFTIDLAGDKSQGDLTLKWGTKGLTASFTAR